MSQSDPTRKKAMMGSGRSKSAIRVELHPKLMAVRGETVDNLLDVLESLTFLLCEMQARVRKLEEAAKR